jgi:hypothetical protein
MFLNTAGVDILHYNTAQELACQFGRSPLF